MDKLQFDNRRSRVQHCPCGKSNTDGKFIPYQGYDNCGYCHSCGEVFLPKLQSDSNDQWRQSEAYKTKIEPKTPPLTSLDYNYFSASLLAKHHRYNVFIQFLKSFFTEQEAKEAIDMYHIGTHYSGKNACLFWYLDGKNICRGKTMQYDPLTCIAPFTNPLGICKRDKKNQYATIEITKNILKNMGKEDFQTPRCFFGSHLLQYEQFQNLPIGIVEAEKTAIIASICNPDFLWLAVGGMQRLDLDLFQTLKGKEIWLYPDLGLPNPKSNLTPYQRWNNKLDAIRYIAGDDVNISKILEEECSDLERQKGYDLADYHLEDYRQKHHITSSNK